MEQTPAEVEFPLTHLVFLHEGECFGPEPVDQGGLIQAKEGDLQHGKAETETFCLISLALLLENVLVLELLLGGFCRLVGFGGRIRYLFGHVLFLLSNQNIIIF